MDTLWHGFVWNKLFPQSGFRMPPWSLLFHLTLLTLAIVGETKKNRNNNDDFFQSEEERLHTHIFRRYNTAIRPVRKATDPVQVNLTFSLMQIHMLDEKVQVFRTYGWLIVEWVDERLKWNAKEYDNMTEFVVASTSLWTPELALINAVEYQFPDFSNYRANINSDGSVRWEPAGVFETSCKIDITFYPYDNQVCSLVFGTWTYTSYKVNMTNSTGLVIMDDYNPSGQWHITGSEVQRKEFAYECCENIRFSKVEVSLHLKRRHRFYTMNLILPCAMLSSLTLVTFLSPPDQGEKISLGISILLSFSVFMLQLSENMPKTSETLPLFGIYTTFVMLMNTWSVMLTVLILNLHHRNEDRPVPGWVRTLVFEGFARVLCMYTRDHLRTKEYRKNHPRPIYGGYSSRRKSIIDPFHIAKLSKKEDEKSGYSLAFAAAKFTGQMRNNSLFIPSSASLNNHQSSNLSQTDSFQNNNKDNSYSSNNSSSDAYEKRSKELEALLEQEHFMNLELQEWKRLARIVDRLFFWMTFLALISEWQDERLSWDPKRYDNMTEFVVASSSIWTPELALINAVEYQFPDFSKYSANVQSSGRVRWEPAGVFETSCKIDITFYPYDTQICSLVFGTWTYTSFKVNMTNSSEEVIMDDYNTSGEWHITDTSVDRREFIYECCPTIRFSKIEASIYLKRRHRFYTLNLVLPCAMLSSLTLVTFLSPPDQGEKISLGISILLSFNVFMLTLSENMPKTSETLPLFGVYTTFVMLMNTWSVMLTVLVLNLHHRNEDKPVPNWVRTLVFEGIARILCMYSKDHLRTRERRTEQPLYAAQNTPRRSIIDPFRLPKNRKRDEDGYSLTFAAAQFTGKMRNTALFVPGAAGTSSPTRKKNSIPRSPPTPESFINNKNSFNCSDDAEQRNRELEQLLQHSEHYISLELQEWKRLARVVDRLFFWLTLLALISVSIGMFCLLWA